MKSKDKKPLPSPALPSTSGAAQLDLLLQLLDNKLEGEAKNIATEALDRALRRGREKMQITLQAIAANRVRRLVEMMAQVDRVDDTIQKKLQAMPDEDLAKMTSFDLLSLGRYFRSGMNDIIVLLTELAKDPAKGGSPDPNLDELLNGGVTAEVLNAEAKILTPTERDRVRRMAENFKAKINRPAEPPIEEAQIIPENGNGQGPKKHPIVRRKKRTP